MKTHSRITFRQAIFAVIFLAAFLLLTVFLFTYRREEQLFTRVSSQLFHDEMTANTLNMHYTIAYPANFGIYNYDAVLPCYSGKDRLASQAQTENYLALLHNLSQQKLSAENRYTHNLLVNSLDASLALSAYPYYEEPLSPSSGMQSQLPILLAEYTFREKQDVEDYLAILDQTDEYFASLLVFEQEKAAAGLLQPVVSLEQVCSQCHTILTLEELDSGTHFLQTTFTERLQGLYDKELITLEEAKQYQAQNNRLLRTVMLPAYEQLADGLLVLEDTSIPLAGLASKPEGAAYYELLLRSQTGSSRSVEQIKELLSQSFTTEYDALKQLLLEDSTLTDSSCMEELETAFPLRNASQILGDLQQRMEQDFPLSDDTAVAVKTVSPNLQDYCAPAFYLTPPLDDVTSNVIYINEKNTPGALDLYTTLAHEGYPGHLYQSVYSNQALVDSATAPVREILWYGGYLEGWALYVEFISFDYASNVMEEQGNSRFAKAVQLEKHNRNVQLCLYSLLDIMIHYDNASFEQVSKVLTSFGITSEGSQSAIYQYIVEEPANYLKYYLGYLEILELKKHAQELWGEAYSDYAFHTFFLECGPSDFATLNSWLETAELPTSPEKNHLNSSVLSQE